SHQMRTPLTIVRTNLDILLRRSVDATAARAMLTDMNDAVTKLQRLVLQLLSMARAEKPGPPPNPVHSFDLAESAQGVIQEYLGAAHAADLSLEYQPAASARVLARGDPFIASEIIGNLLDNAIRYGRLGGHVSIRIHAQPCPAIVI